MAQDYGISETSINDYRDIIAGEFPIEQYPNITVANQGKTLKRGTPLGKKTADDKYYEWDSEASDGTENLDGILVNDLDVSEGDQIGTMYITGEFNKTAIYTASSIEVTAGVYNNTGLIIVREEVS